MNKRRTWLVVLALAALVVGGVTGSFAVHAWRDEPPVGRRDAADRPVLREVSVEQLRGAWRPVRIFGRVPTHHAGLSPGQALLRFLDAETYSVGDGFNQTSGEYALGERGAFEARPGSTTRVGCVPPGEGPRHRPAPEPTIVPIPPATTAPGPDLPEPDPCARVRAPDAVAAADRVQLDGRLLVFFADGVVVAEFERVASDLRR